MDAVPENYRARIGAWVKARLLRNPNAVRIEAEDLDLFVIRDMLSPDQCRAMIELIDSNLVPSQLLSPTDDPEYRTSKSCNMDPRDPLVQALEARLHEVVGIQSALSETVQGQRYAVGEQFKPHWDYFLPSESYWPEQARTGGQRTWTAMLFLNEPEGGGHTNFTKAGLSVRPRAGNLLVWNNLTPDGEVNPRSMHQGSPVTAGTKYIVTKWYRERAWTPLPVEAAAG